MKVAFLVAVIGAVSASSKPRCQEERQQALSSGLIGAYAPMCDENGNYAKFQCRGSVCFCADPATGKEVDGTQSHISGYDEIKEQCMSGSFGVLEAKAKRPTSACEKEREKKMKLMGALRPICDDTTGAYKIQCHEAHCYCADPMSGEPDYSFEMGNTHLEELERKCMETMTRCRKQRYDAAQRPTIIGQHVMTCDEKGLFEKAQCKGSTCFCVDEISGRTIKGTETHVSDHRPERCQKTECMAQNEEHNVPGKWMPKCDSDRGNFLPVQCRESVCYCVDRTSGEKVGDSLEVGRVSELHTSCMTDCERLRDLGQKPKILYSLYTKKPRCEANGDYHNVQCKEAECTCVDENGQLAARPKPISQLHQLERQCKGGLKPCQNKKVAFRWSQCPAECTNYEGYGEALVRCCCD